MHSYQNLISKITAGEIASLARAITLVENNLPEGEALLFHLPSSNRSKVIGITGPPGAGKSTLINAILSHLSVEHKVAVISIDPSSPFNLGALLGDRIRMSDFFLNKNVYIRSLASRGSLGGLCAKIIEILDVVKAAPFDYIIVETVGVGQSEIEISGLADTTVVVMVPEAGDEIQTMKAGVMEIADIFIVNKADRSNANEFAKNLTLLIHDQASEWTVPVLKCVATEKEGIAEVIEQIKKHLDYVDQHHPLKLQLLCEKVFLLIQQHRMQNISKEKILNQLQAQFQKSDFNLYQFAKSFDV